MKSLDLPMAGHGSTTSADAVHQLKLLAHDDPAFARALRQTASTQEAARLARRHGIEVSPEAIWRNRGMLTSGGLPTWRG
jgi:predicted NAD-dependent protein-ADP-ribosyltransferase YbiA (DUF1768 family)